MLLLGDGVIESMSFALMKDAGFWWVDPWWLALVKRADESVLVIQFWSLCERMIATARSWSCPGNVQMVWSLESTSCSSTVSS